MTVEQLRTVHQASPFKPFTLHLADGNKLRVAHRELLSHSESGRTIIVHGENETFNVIDLLLVTRLEVEDLKLARKGKGRNGRRS